MMLQRSRVTTFYPDGRTEDFNPRICWHLTKGLAEISTRNSWALGLMWRWRIGTYSIFRTLFVEIGHLTVYAHCGVRGVHNPRDARPLRVIGDTLNKAKRLLKRHHEKQGIKAAGASKE